MTNNKVFAMFILGVISLMPLAGQSAHDDQATVFVYRAKARMVARGLHPSIYCDGIELVRLHQGNFIQVAIPAGKHVITTGRSEVGQFVDFEAGKKYYFEFDHRNIWGVMVSGAPPIILTRVSEHGALLDMDGLKQVKTER